MSLRIILTRLIGCLILLSKLSFASSSILDGPFDNRSVSSPLPPAYSVKHDDSISLRLCYNWSCASRQTIIFTPEDIELVKKRMAACANNNLHNRLQRIRIGIWQMELLAEKYQPLLANDLPQNDDEEGVLGRTDCVDNSSNTTNYLHILQELGELQDWTVSTPDVRNRFNPITVHWSAVIIDNKSGHSWSVDSWFRPNGHLPMVMPLEDWGDEKNAWEEPFLKLNEVPEYINGLCQN